MRNALNNIADTYVCNTSTSVRVKFPPILLYMRKFFLFGEEDENEMRSLFFMTGC